MAKAIYLNAAKRHPETRRFKVLEQKKIKKMINKKIVIIKQSSSDIRKSYSGG